jgi:hypothetical protein
LQELFLYLSGSETSFSELGKLVAGDPADGGHFGQKISINGDYAIVGAPYKKGGGS